MRYLTRFFCQTPSLFQEKGSMQTVMLSRTQGSRILDSRAHVKQIPTMTLPQLSIRMCFEMHNEIKYGHFQLYGLVDHLQQNEKRKGRMKGENAKSKDKTYRSM